jgi:hypothetical protein
MFVSTTAAAYDGIAIIACLVVVVADGDEE